MIFCFLRYNKSMSENFIPLRKDVNDGDKWDLSGLYNCDEDWECDLKKLDGLSKKVVAFKGRLGESKESLLAALKAFEEFNMLLESVYHYASLKTSEDQGDSLAQEKENRVMMAYTQAAAEQSFWDAELMAIDDDKINEWMLSADFKDYKVFLEKSLYQKEHTLSEKEERLLSLSAEALGASGNTFSLLTDVDLSFGSVTVDGREKVLSQGTWSSFMENEDRNVRKEAYTKFYGAFKNHANTLASLYAGSVNKDVFLARARGYKSSLDRALSGDKVPESIYYNLIDTVHKNIETLHRYYSIRKKALKVDQLRHYDVYVPLVEEVKTHIPYEEGVEICRAALAPLGKEYTDTLCDGLLHGWADRYENQGKRSGAFSSGCYKGYPYILLNYKENSIGSVYTMAHEGGHSMHSWNSVRNNPFMCYEYTIFEAETASTFNEELIFEYLVKNTGDEKMKKFLTAKRVDEILATLHRQTMFAEFELKAHQAVEGGQPLTTDFLRKTYRELLEFYFGPEMVLEDESDLEGLRIPHFYNQFYVYQYATGISASLALAKRVTNGGEKELNDYFTFLKSGGSRYPIEALKAGGVDMAESSVIQSALDTFKSLVDKLDSYF